MHLAGIVNSKTLGQSPSMVTDRLRVYWFPGNKPSKSKGSGVVMLRWLIPAEFSETVELNVTAEGTSMLWMVRDVEVAELSSIVTTGSVCSEQFRATSYESRRGFRLPHSCCICYILLNSSITG